MREAMHGRGTTRWNSQRAVRSSGRRHRHGYTLIEMVVAAGLATLLMTVLAFSWAAFGRPTIEVEARARITQEGILAAHNRLPVISLTSWPTARGEPAPWVS